MAEAGINVGVLVAPIIPGLNDSGIPQILKEAKACGAKSATHTLLRLPGSVKPVFISRIEKYFPLQSQKILHRIREVREGKLSSAEFGQRHHGNGPYWENIERLFGIYCEKLGLNQTEKQINRYLKHLRASQKTRVRFLILDSGSFNSNVWLKQLSGRFGRRVEVDFLTWEYVYKSIKGLLSSL